MTDYLKIDGSQGEGGGSILRVAAGLACVNNRPIFVSNIRASRKNPGLRLQHLLGLEAVQKLTDGFLSKAEVGSTSVKFQPGESWINSLSIKIDTAGNIGLLSQTLQNALIKAPEDNYHVKFVGGGTYGKWAPGTEYLNNLTFPLFQKCGYHINIDVNRHGFYPKGGAEASLTVKPNYKKYKGLQLLEQGDLEKIKCVIHTENRLKRAKVGERIEKSIERNLYPQYEEYLKHNISYQYHDSLSVGVGIDAWIKYSNGVNLGIGTFIAEKKMSSEQVGVYIARLIDKRLSSRETVDEYASDQIMPFLSIVEDRSEFILSHISSHLKTNIEIISKFMDRKIQIDKDGEYYKVTIL